MKKVRLLMRPCSSRLLATRVRLLPLSTEKAYSCVSAGSTGLMKCSSTAAYTPDASPKTMSRDASTISTGRRIFHSPLYQ